MPQSFVPLGNHGMQNPLFSLSSASSPRAQPLLDCSLVTPRVGVWRTDSFHPMAGPLAGAAQIGLVFVLQHYHLARYAKYDASQLGYVSQLGYSYRPARRANHDSSNYGLEPKAGIGMVRFSTTGWRKTRNETSVGPIRGLQQEGGVVDKQPVVNVHFNLRRSGGKTVFHQPIRVAVIAFVGVLAGSGFIIIRGLLRSMYKKIVLELAGKLIVGGGRQVFSSCQIAQYTLRCIRLSRDKHPTALMTCPQKAVSPASSY